MEQSTKSHADQVLLEIRTSRTGEETPESMVQFLLSLVNLKHHLLPGVKKGIPFTLEMAVENQQVKFYIGIPRLYQSFIESQLTSQYPKVMITRMFRDYLQDVLADTATLSLGQLKLSRGYYLPIRTFSEFKDVDPMSSVLSVLAKSQPGDAVSIQYLLLPISTMWQRSGASIANPKKGKDGTTATNPHAKEILEKVSQHGFKVAIRIGVNGPTKERSTQFAYEIGNSFTSYNHPNGNSLHFRRPILWQAPRLLEAMRRRSKSFMPFRQVLNVNEIASLYHFPTMKLATIHNITWHQVILSQAPENLPVAESLTEEEKQGVNFFARTEFKNKQTVFGIKKVDRRRHLYVVGKSGTGKSTFIANMAINDMRNGEGFCVIDPHGDLCEDILRFVPSNRVNDIIYLDPSDNLNSFAINPFEVKNQLQKELVASGIVAIFKKIFGESWGPRLEYILRNTVVSVLEMPDPTLLMVPEVLANPAFRAKVVERLTDPVIRSFWLNEFERMQERQRIEAISPIQNKVGQFISSVRIRNIVGHPHSSIDIEKAMNEGKILLLNLSQGYLGEDNAALLGAMIITKIQLAAMNRVSIPEPERRDFYLYVDEFQNFATTSFIKILSEARKFRLCLILANQYIAQIAEDVRAAIFGNAGTILSFLVGAADAGYLATEFSERFKAEDLLALGNYQAIIKLYIDGITQPPFHCYTLPLPKSQTQNADKAKRISRERYTKPVEKMAEEAREFYGPQETPPPGAFSNGAKPGGFGAPKKEDKGNYVPRPVKKLPDGRVVPLGPDGKEIIEAKTQQSPVAGRQSSDTGAKERVKPSSEGKPQVRPAGEAPRSPEPQPR